MVLRSKQLLLMVIPIALIGISLPAQDLEVSARLYDEQVYFPNSTVSVLITLGNDSPEPVSFRLADDRRHNLAFDVRDESNRPLGNTPEFIIANQSNQQIFYRTVMLQPGEQLSFVERLTDYIMIEESGMYNVRINFFPQLNSSQDAPSHVSNRFSLTIRPGSTPEIRREMRFEAAAEAQLRRQALSPDEVVQYMLEARQESNWERFFLYLNLEKLYRQVPSRDARFIRLSQEEQLSELRTFRGNLRSQDGGPDSSLVAIPDGYTIIETRYSPTDGQVTARLFFNRDRYRERRQYAYELERRDGFWEIIGYQVSNLPNEALQR
ncbi:MAG: hypothetical protein WD492_04575 [Alkalispirochaeta sp.]